MDADEACQRVTLFWISQEVVSKYSLTLSILSIYITNPV